MDSELKNSVKTGTTILGIVCKDGVVMASDNRVTIGQGLIVQKDYEKVDGYLSILTRHVGNTANILVSLTSEFGRLGNKISSTRRISPQKETSEELVS